MSFLLEETNATIRREQEDRDDQQLDEEYVKEDQECRLNKTEED